MQEAVFGIAEILFIVLFLSIIRQRNKSRWIDAGKPKNKSYTNRKRAASEKHPHIDKLINLRSRPACTSKRIVLMVKYS